MLVGGTISNLVTAIELSQTHDVTVVELNAEIGLPCVSPGHIRDLDVLEPYLTPEQLAFLQPFSFEAGYTLRSEWVLKHLGTHAAQKGVDILTRTRISDSFTTDDGFLIEFIGAGRARSGQVEGKYLVDDRQWTYIAPGSKVHNIDSLEYKVVPSFGVFIPMNGGTALHSDCLDLPSEIYSLPRHEGLTEVWQENFDWLPKRGWIETVQCSLPQKHLNRDIDAQINEGRRVAKQIKLDN